MSKTIAIGGENLIDFVETQTNEGLPQYTAHPGGGPYNIAMAAGRQGGDVSYLTPISNDRLGQMLAKNLIDSDVTIFAHRLDEPTSLAVVSLENNAPSYQFYREGTAERQITETKLADVLSDMPWLFHIGSLALAGGGDSDAWENLFNKLSDKGVITSIDPNVRANLIPDPVQYIKRIERMIKKADILKLSDEDIAWLYPNLSIDEAFDHICLIAGSGIKVMTKGAEGAVARSDAARISTPSYKIDQLADTVGAGDTFMATMLVWLRDQKITLKESIHQLEGHQLEQMMTRAATAAGINCTRSGCNPPKPDEIDALIG